MSRRLVLLLVALIAACGSSPEGSTADDGPQVFDDGPEAPDADPLAPDASGDGGPAPAFAVSWPADTLTDVEPGQLVLLDVIGAPAEPLYTAQLAGSTPLVAAMGATQLVFVVPPLSSGTHTLVVHSGELQAELDFVVVAFEPIAAPGTFVAARFGALDLELQELENDVTMAAHAAAFAEVRGWLQQAEDAIAELSPAELEQVAYALRAAERALPAEKLAGWSVEPACNSSLDRYMKALGTALFAGPLAGAAAGYYALATLTLLPAVAVGVAAAVAVTAAVSWWKTRNQLEKDIVPAIVDNCVGKVAMRITEDLEKPVHTAAASETLTFQHGRKRVMWIETSVQLEQEAVDELEAAQERLEMAASRLPPTWVPDLGEHDTEPYWRAGAPGSLSLVVGDPMVTGEIGVVGGAVELDFRFADLASAPSSPWYFTFQLVPDGSPELASYHTAVLEPPSYRLVLADGSPLPIPLTFVSGQPLHIKLVAADGSTVVDHQQAYAGTQDHQMTVTNSFSSLSIDFWQTVPISFVQRPIPAATLVVSYGGQVLEAPIRVRQQTAYELGYRAYIGDSFTAPFKEIPCGQALTMPTNANIWPALTRHGQVVSTHGGHTFSGTPMASDQHVGAQVIRLYDDGLTANYLECPVDVTLSNLAFRSVTSSSFLYFRNGVATHRFQFNPSGALKVTRLQDGLVLANMWAIPTFNYRVNCVSGAKFSLSAHVAFNSSPAYDGSLYLHEGGTPFACPGFTSPFVKE